MKSIKALIGVSILTSLTIGVTACGTAQPSNSQTNSITAWDIQTSAVQNAIKAETATYNRQYPNEQVKFSWYQNNPYKQKLRIVLGSGSSTPTIFMNWGGGILKSYVDTGDVYNLTNILNQDPTWKDKFLPYVWSMTTFAGKIYGIPYTDSTAAFWFYNKKIFQQYNLTPPTTWQQLIHVVQVLHSHGVIPIAVAGSSQWPYEYYIEFLTQRIGGMSVVNKILSGSKSVWSDPSVIKAETMIQQLVRAGAFEPGYAGVSMNSEETAKLMTSGKTAMELVAEWEYANYHQFSPSFVDNDLGWFTFPSVQGGKGNLTDQFGVASNYYSINAHASPSQIQNAIQYLKTVPLDKNMIHVWLSQGEVPPVRGIGNLIQQSPASQRNWLEYLYQQQKAAKHYTIAWDQGMSPTEATLFLRNLSELFSLQITPQQMAQNMESAQY